MPSPKTSRTTLTRRPRDSAPTRMAFLVRSLHRRTPVRFILLVALLVLTPVLSIAFGAAPVPIGQVLGVLADHCGLPVHLSWDSITDAIVWQNRMPRIVTGLGVGAILGAAGVTLQAVVRNPLAEPYVLGVSAGASSGAATAIILVGISSTFGVAGMAFLGALASTAIVLFMGGGRNSSTLRLILAGLAVGFVFQALTNFIIFSSDSPETARAVMFWTLGDLSRASWAQGWTSIVVAVVLSILLWICAPWLDALASGDSTATAVGIDPAMIRVLLLVPVSAGGRDRRRDFGRDRFRRVGDPPPHAFLHRTRPPPSGRLLSNCSSDLPGVGRHVFPHSLQPGGAADRRHHRSTRRTLPARTRKEGDVGMINASQLVVRRGQRIVLENIDFSAGQGVTVGVVGPNGAGKSTLLSALYRNVSIASGQVTVSDHDLASMSRREIAREVAVVSQTPDPSLPLTVRDTVALGRLPHRSLMGYGDAADRNIVEEALTRTDLTDLADRLVTQLSGGERQRVLVARAIAQQAGHLLLDEPTNHLDIGHQFALLDLVRTIKATTVIVLHDLNLAARVCDQLVSTLR